MKNRIVYLIGFAMFFMLGILAADDILGMAREAGSIKAIYGSYLPFLYLMILPIGPFIIAVILLIKAFRNKE